MYQFGKHLMTLILYVYWSDIRSVNCWDKLDFWEPDLELNARRSNDHSYSNTKDRPYYRHSRGPAIKNGKEEAEKHVRVKHLHPVLRTRYQEFNRDRNINNERGSVREEHKRDRERALRYGHDQTRGAGLSQNRPQSRLRNKNDRPILRSTRITPMYLMQQSPEQTTAKPIDEVLKLEELSPYFITRQMEHIMANFLNANSTVEIVGRTAAYNDIVLIKITEKNQEDGPAFRAEEDKYIVDKPEKKIIFIVHGLNILGIHNLQCLSNVTEFTTLVSYYLEHLDKFDIFLIPLANPDGYARKELFWNKNISPQAACPGVSLDRNFDVAWNTSKSISSCSPIYAGSNPFSEPEARAVRDVLHHFSHKIIAYIHVHAGSYDEHTYKGEAVLYPKGYTDAQTDDDKYLDLRGEVEEAMKNASFKITSVTVDTLYNWYGKVSGSSVDYASTIYGIPFALEFVMQLYTKAILQRIALKEIWKRMVDVVFNNIWKSINANEVK